MIGALLGIAGSFLGSSAGGTIASTALQMLPGLMKGSGSGTDRTILDIKNQQQEIDSYQFQAQMMQKARTTVATARALLAGTGFDANMGSQSMLADQSFENLDRNLGMAKYNMMSNQLSGKIKQNQGSIANSLGLSPVSSKLFETTLQPLLSSGIKSLGGMLSSFGS